MPATQTPPNGAPRSNAPRTTGLLSWLGLFSAASIGGVFGATLGILMIQLLETASGDGSLLSRLGLLASGYLVGVAVGRSGGYRRFTWRVVAALFGLGATLASGYGSYLLDYYPTVSEFSRAVSESNWQLFERWLSRSMGQIGGGQIDGILIVASSWLAYFIAGRTPFRVRADQLKS